ncbi:MAG: hypothetical protein V3W37_02935 [Candidatus Binatia bacterium]
MADGEMVRTLITAVSAGVLGFGGAWLGTERRISNVSGDVRELRAYLKGKLEGLTTSLERCQKRDEEDHKDAFERLRKAEGCLQHLKGKMNSAGKECDG